ncbi:MAG: hypothetical protein R3E10_11515 [Gemmatimonadota bacterium]
MKLTLESVTFDHDQTSASADALTIRRNAGIPVCPPEWVHGVTADEYGASVAAYARDRVAGNTITIKAVIRSDESADPQSVEIPPTIRIRTLDAMPLAGCLPGLFARLRGSPPPPAPPGVLGVVPPTDTLIGHLHSHEQTLPLTGSRIAEVGIGRHDIAWFWQYQVQGETTWTTFASTKHRIYTVLDTPTAPWGQPPNHVPPLSLPWIDALDVVCSWASGAQTADEAAAIITERIFNAGPAVFGYDCDGGSAYYSYDDLDLTAALERIRGGPGNGGRVNCSDCASLVSTLADLIGHDLGQQQFSWGLGNGVLRLIGDTAGWSSCVGPFGWHEVAWHGTGVGSDLIWDACAALDGDPDPANPPHSALIPRRIPHSAPWVGSYVWRAATPRTEAEAAPDFQPYGTPPIRRAVF